MSTTSRLHDRALELAAAALDFRLPAAELAELERHLAACPACARTTGGLRGDLALLRHPATLLPPRRVDDAVHAAIAGRDPRTSPQRLFVLVAATALLLVALLGVAAAGALLLQRRPPVVVVDPSPSVPAVVVEDSSASPGPVPSAEPPPAWAPAPASFPVADGTAQLVAGPDGGTYVLVSTARDDAAGRRTGSVLALLDTAGDPRTGWPIAVDGWYCDNPSSSPWPPVVAGDGSVTVVCLLWETSDGSTRTSATTFDAAGRQLAAWSYGGEPAGRPRVVDGRLLVVASDVTEEQVTGDDGQPSTRTTARYRLEEVATDGARRSGVPIDVGEPGWPVVLGPDGTAYHVDMANGVITAFDLDGPLAGWPARLDGSLSALGFGSDGRVYMTVASASQGASRLVVLARDGSTVTTSEPLGLQGVSAYSGAGPEGRPMAPLVADDGTAFIIGEANDHTVVYAIDSSGAAMGGWPHRADTEVQWQGACPAETAGCGVRRAIPAVGPGGVVYLPLAAPDAQIGGSMVAIGRDGKAVAGWPMHLARRGAECWAAAGSDGIAWALAVEPETGGGTSATILAFATDGTVRSRTTVIDSKSAP